VRALPAFACLALAACAAPPDTACLLPGETQQLVIEMFFGRDVAGRGPVSDAEWADFAATVLTAQFKDGFTILDGEGQWRDPATGRIAREPTKILVVATPRSDDLPGRIDAAMAAYKRRFNQQSVGLITRPGCADF
jgi:hypothetical protein